LDDTPRHYLAAVAVVVPQNGLDEREAAVAIVDVVDFHLVHAGGERGLWGEAE